MPGRLCCSAPCILRGYARPATLGQVRTRAATPKLAKKLITPATIAVRPRDPSPLERAIPPQTTPTRPPMGNMASPRPARTRPATAQGRPSGVAPASAIRPLELGPDLVEVGPAVALDVLGRLQQAHPLGARPAVELVQQLLDPFQGPQGGRARPR